MTTYEVGQIIYLIQPQKLAVIPVQVAEQIIKRTTSGEDIIYNVQPPNTTSLVALNSFEGEVFEDLLSVKNYLMDNAQKSIDALVDKTEKTVELSFGIKLSAVPEPEIITPPAKKRRGRPKKNPVKTEDTVQVDLGNGQIGNIKMSDELQKLVT